MDDAAPTLVHMCAACTRAGACRLGLIEERLVEGGASLSRLVCSAAYEGGPGVAHGGWTAEAMDEVMGHHNILSGRMAVTASLTVEYKRPVPIERPLLLRAWCEKVENGRRHNRGELTLEATGAVLARAHGVFVERDPSHFDRYRRWLASQDDNAKDAD